MNVFGLVRILDSYLMANGLCLMMIVSIEWL